MIALRPHCSCRVTWSDEDNEFVAICLEVPSASWLAPASTEAATATWSSTWQRTDSASTRTS